jgi:hypothetical protein
MQRLLATAFEDKPRALKPQRGDTGQLGARAPGITIFQEVSPGGATQAVPPLQGLFLSDTDFPRADALGCPVGPFQGPISHLGIVRDLVEVANSATPSAGRPHGRRFRSPNRGMQSIQFGQA